MKGPRSSAHTDRSRPTPREAFSGRPVALCTLPSPDHPMEVPASSWRGALWAKWARHGTVAPLCLRGSPAALSQAISPVTGPGLG